MLNMLWSRGTEGGVREEVEGNKGEVEGKQTSRLDRGKERKDKNRDPNCKKEKEDTTEDR